MQRDSRDSILNTFVVAISVCLVCSFLVSSAAVVLRARQNRNVDLDRKKNILVAAGFTSQEIDQAGGVFQLFEKRVEPIIIELATGKPADLTEIIDAAPDDKITNEQEALDWYNQIEAARKPISGLYADFENRSDDLAGISRKEKYSHVYLVNGPDGQIEKYVFPIRGKGLWSILKGFIAVEADFQTISGLTYYEHAETPGLGGEVDNRMWKEKWVGKSIFRNGDVGIAVIKGTADSDDPFAVDGLSGATITSRGVTNMLKFWLGPQGFGPFIDHQKSSGTLAANLLPGER